jgi:hypothetical protein
MEKGTKAFVSYIRGYKEHHCKYVFQLADLSIEHVGYMFGLLRLPVMKEVRTSICMLPMNNCVTECSEAVCRVLMPNIPLSLCAAPIHSCGK